MVLALPEGFFKDWEWQEGDQFIDLKDHDIGYIGQYIIDNNIVKGMWNDGGYELENEIRPFPSQERLQELILNNFLKFDETAKTYDVITFCCDWFQAHYTFEQPDKEVENDSGKSIWLRYAMSVIYQKMWDGEAWI